MNTHTKQSGFTLIETLVSISIFSVSLVALIVASSQGISDMQFIKGRLTATYLAQEGIELVRNVRDEQLEFGSGSTSAANWSSFMNFVSSCGISSGTVGCMIDGVSNAGSNPIFKNSCTTFCGPILYDGSLNGYGYNYTFGNPTNYTRTVSVKTLSPDEIEIKSTVNFLVGSQTLQVTLYENILGWTPHQ